MGVPFSKNNCYEYYGMQIVYNETFARNKEREIHNKKLGEFHSQQEDHLDLKYIPVLNTQSNMHGMLTLLYINILEVINEGS